MEWYKGETGLPIRRQISAEICRRTNVTVEGSLYCSGAPPRMQDSACSRMGGPCGQIQPVLLGSNG